MDLLKNGVMGKSLTSNPVSIAQKLVSKDSGMPPNVQTLLAKYGNSPIKYIKINRQAVQSGMTAMLNLFSKNQSNFSKELAKQPYDKLYHLQMQFSTAAGRVVLEKNERVSMSERPKEVEVMPVPFPAGLTINQIYQNALKAYGAAKFYSYSASSNNCQDFIMMLLTASKLASPQVTAFTKQDTSTLFAKDPRLRKISNSVTTFGAKANILMQGGAIEDLQQWTNHVQEHHKNNGGTYKDAMQNASSSYKKGAPEGKSRWLQHVASYQRKHNCSYKEAMQGASASYKK
jgi:hypothetical protein